MQLNNSFIPDNIVELNTDYNNFVVEEYEDILRATVRNPKYRFQFNKREKDLFLNGFTDFYKKIGNKSAFHEKAAKHYSLTAEESFILLFYTTNGSGQINFSLRENGNESAPSYIKKYRNC